MMKSMFYSILSFLKSKTISPSNWKLSKYVLLETIKYKYI